MTTKEQAQNYVQKVGVKEAKQSNHYLTAQRHCFCGVCFYCFVKYFVDLKENTLKDSCYMPEETAERDVEFLKNK